VNVPGDPLKEQLVELFEVGLTESLTALVPNADRDWSTRAGTLDWSCWITVDHVTDCLFSYALQVAGAVRGGWLKLEELHARPEATPSELLAALAAVGRMFAAVLRDAPEDLISSDGYVDLRLSDWVARALNEVMLHTHDVLTGLGEQFEPRRDVCSFVLSNPGVWMYDSVEDRSPVDAWPTMLAASERRADV
jgi:hypothetical protein